MLILFNYIFSESKDYSVAYYRNFINFADKHNIKLRK